MATALNGCPSTSSRHNRETTLQSYFLLFDRMNTNWNVEFTVRPLLVPITLSAFWHSINICIFFSPCSEGEVFSVCFPSLCI